MKERWDIELLFLSGPYADFRPRIYKGPQVLIGSAPSVGGVLIKGVSIAPVHARIDCYDGKRVMLHPIEHHETRVASHKNEDWNRIDPIFRPVPLQDGNVIYVGPIGHGVIFEFLRAKTFQLREKQISSVVDQNDQIDISLANNTKANRIHTSQYPSTRFFHVGSFIQSWISIDSQRNESLNTSAVCLASILISRSKTRK